MVISAGGDYELAFTVGPDGLEAARKVCALTMMSEVVAEGIWMVQGGQWRRMEAMGYEAQDWKQISPKLPLVTLLAQK
jgi:thiamine monophosphate kinase